MTGLGTHPIIRLSDGIAEVDILPGYGATICRYEIVNGGSRHPIFVPTSFGSVNQSIDIASILLAPWSNRISGGGFEHEGFFVALEPNMDGEPLPIHGNAFQLAWTIVEQDGAAARLQVQSTGPGEFRYLATVDYSLSDGALRVDLSIMNTGERPLPFGFGVHPWLLRTPKMTLRFKSKMVWLEDEHYLPVDCLKVETGGAWDFSETRPLPEHWINNGFGGWDGEAEIIWPESRLRMRIEASKDLGHCIVFSPYGGAPFFCFEPVSHPVDAHNALDQGPSTPKTLVPGDIMTMWCRFIPLAEVDPVEGECIR